MTVTTKEAVEADARSRYQKPMVRTKLPFRQNLGSDDPIVSDSLAKLKIHKQKLYSIEKDKAFIVGEILIKAKEDCKIAGIKFMNWIEDNYPHSHKKAALCMSVYKCCFGYEENVQEIPDTILYRIASNECSEELRTWALSNANLIKWTGKKLDEVIENYVKGGIDKVESAINELNKIAGTDRQIKLFLTEFKRCLDFVDSTIKNFEFKAHARSSYMFELSLESYDPAAVNIIRPLYVTLTNSAYLSMSMLLPLRCTE